jgi:hypothetical protein
MVPWTGDLHFAVEVYRYEVDAAGGDEITQANSAKRNTNHA